MSMLESAITGIASESGKKLKEAAEIEMVDAAMAYGVMLAEDELLAFQGFAPNTEHSTKLAEARSAFRNAVHRLRRIEQFLESDQGQSLADRVQSRLSETAGS